ncbi:MAG TPA: hypothetical protein VFG68_06755 [Fimbriiglobus sp.]|nr:hypothetical protein [Fimbriiglobus sp.]
MASVLPPPSAPAKLDATLDQEIGKATGRIRLNDLLAGGLTLAVLTLAFVAAAILLDRWLVLPERVRQALLGGFVLTVAVVGYFTLLRPLRRAVNPRFAARRVEETVPEAKNALINWVDLRDKDLPAVVRAAVGTKAVEGVTGADVNKAVESKRVVWLAAVAGLLLALLAALFVVFKPAPFLSLVSRTFNPFTVTKIATRTELSIEEPQGGDVTVTAGDPVTVRVYVGGSVPDPDGPGRVRLRVRYNPAVPEYDELPLEPGGTAREWVLRVPRTVVQNGFWYTVAGGDAETAEHRVTVRSRPLFQDEFEARYVYPAYTRLKPEVSGDRNLWGYPGTEVTLTAKTNRQVKDAKLSIEGPTELTRVQIIGEAKDTIQYKLTLKQSGTYRMEFTSTDGEASDPSPTYAIRIATDRVPTVSITSPAEAEISLPANGLLAVDAALDDDFGLTAAKLHVQQINDKGEVVRDFKSKPYRDGKPLLRESDQTYPTRLAYKDSVALGSLTVDPGGQVATLKEGMVLQYWVEATDNCTEPKPNVGKSAIKRIKIATPPKEPEKKQQQEKAQQQRGAEEQQHQQQQDQQLKNEKRDPPPQLRPEEQPNPKPNDGQPGSEEPKQDTKPEEPKPADDSNPKDTETPKPKQGGTGENPMQPKGTPQEQTTQPEVTSPPRETQPQPNQGGNTQDTKTPPKKGGNPQQNEAQKAKQQAQDVQKAIDQQERQPGDARNQGTDQGKPSESPADRKPTGQPPSDGQAEQKAGQPTGDSSGQSKPQGNVEQPKPADAKPQPSNPQQSPGSEPTGDTPKHPPIAGNTPAQERPQPKTPSQGESAGDQKPTDSGAARGNESPRPGQPEQGRPAGEPKPMPEASRGQERPKEGTGTDQTKPAERPAEARGPKPTDPGTSKQRPSGSEPNQPPAAGEKPQPGAAGTEPKNSRNSPADAKPDSAKPPPGATTNEHPRAKGSEKSAQPEGTGQGEKNIDPKEIEQAAKDLASGDAQKQQAARDKLDKLMGNEAREQAERDAKQLAEDLQSKDAATRQAAEQKLKDLAKKAEQHAGQGNQGKPLSDAEKQKLQEMTKDLTSDNAAKREAAEKAFDNAVGQKRREQLQQMAKDAQSGDAKKQAEAQKKFNEMMKSDTPGGQGKQPSAEEIQKWADKAKDLNSPDQGKREAAEKEFDDKFGPEARKDLQEAMKDPKKAAEARKKFEEMAGKSNKDWRPGGGASRGKEVSLHESDPRNRLKSAELQLKSFEENRNNKELQNKLGWTQEEYDTFLKAQQQRVAQMREEVVKQDQPETAPPPTGPAALHVGEGSNGSLKTRSDGTTGTTGGAGPGTAPPGYADPQRKFAEAAAKLRKGQDKK